MNHQTQVRQGPAESKRKYHEQEPWAKAHLLEHPLLASKPDRGPERLPEMMPLPASWSLRTWRKEKKGAAVSAASQSSSDQIAVSTPHYRLDRDENSFPLRRQPTSRGSRGTY